MKKCGVILFCVLFVAVSFLLAAVHPAHSEDVIKLKFANWFPPTHKMSMVAEEWCKEVEKRTNGKVKVTYFPGGTLIPAAQTYEGIINGIADVGLHTQQYSTGRFPLTEVMYLPIRVKNARQATRLMNAWYDKFRPKEYDDTKVLYHFLTGPISFQTVKPITSTSDLKGMKIRGGGDSAKIIRALGATPVSVPMADSYDGFQRGVMQGTLQCPEVLKGWRFGDLMKTFLVDEAIGAPQTFVVFMNKRKWAALPPDIQKTIERVSKEWSDKTAVAWDQTDKEGIDYGVSKGMKIVKVSAAEEEVTIQKMKPIHDEYVTKMKKMGLPGEEALKFCLDFVKNNP